MEVNSWRPAQGEPSAADAAAGDWRIQLQHDARQRIINRIMNSLNRRLPISVPEGLNELQKIAVQVEEKIYAAATSESDYLKKLSLKMLSMETRSQHTPSINPSMLNTTVPSQIPMDPASVDSTAQTGPAVVADWQEEIYQKIKSMREMYFADLNELYQKVALKLQQPGALKPPAKPSEQLEKMKNFKIMLEHVLALLQISKNNIQPPLKEKLPLYEIHIINLLALNIKKAIPSEPEGQQGGLAHSMPQQQPSQVTQL